MRAAIQSKRLAWGVAAAACTLAVASVAAVAMLSPLKTVEPYVIRVDKSSGETQVVTALKGRSRAPMRMRSTATSSRNMCGCAKAGSTMPRARTPIRSCSPAIPPRALVT
ncbi:VirB8/TrbF family protein [Sphingomonas aerolata]